MLEADEKRQQLQRYMAKYSGAPLPEAESMGLLGSALDVVTRPASAVMGALYGAVAPEISPLEGFMEGLRGEEYYGTYNLLTAAGMDPESRLTRGLGLVGDIVNPLDPLNYVGFGFSKAGKLANVLGHGTEALGKLPTREAAALLGHWSPLTIAGQAMGPRALNARVARGVDAVGARISKSETVQTLGRYFGGVRKLEAKFPGISRIIRGEERVLAADAEATSRELTGIMDGLRAKGLKETEVEKVMRETAGLLESPEDKYFRLGREWELLDRAERGEFVQWRPDDVLDPADLPQFKAANQLTQQQVDQRVGELMLARREAGAGQQLTVDSGQLTARDALRAGKDAAGLNEIENELHVLQSVQVSRLAGDLPPEYTAMMAGRKQQLSVEMGKVRELWDEASDDARDTFKLIKPLIDDTKKIYEDVLRGYDPKFQFPVDDYLKHMFPVHWSRLPGAVAKKQAAAEAKVQAYAAELAAKGYDEASITQMVRTNLKEESALVTAADRGEMLTGDLDAFKQRQVKMTIKEVNDAAADGTLPWAFEDHSAIIASAMRRDATRWKFGHDINKWVTEQPGWTIGGENYAALSKAEQKNWVPMQFHLPWIDGAKNPFKGKYMAREVHELMQAQLRGVGMLTNDAGLNSVMQAMHGMRRWWTSWTLAPFPNFHVRNLASDMIQSSQAGLSPLKDLMKAPMGESAYAASMGFQMARKGLPDDRGAWKAGKASLDNLTATLSNRFGEDVTVERLKDWMELEGIVGSKGVRDLDVNALFSKDPVFQQALKKRSKASRAADFLPFQAPGRSPIIRAGFKVGEEMSDYTRTALFFDTLRKVAPEAKSLDQAMEYATATVRKHLFDYGDLTTFERQFMRLAMPFYTFSSKNIPLQVEKMMTDPKHLQWTARLYQGAWGQFDDTEIKPEDLPDWLEEGLGLPMQKVETAEGASTYAIWSPRGWLPQTELNEMADLLRGKAGTQILARLNPALKESFEQMLNTDSYTQRQIDDGTIRDVLGVVMEDLGGAVATLAEDAGAPQGSLDSLRGKGVPNSVARRVGHLLNNFRLVTELDKLDPGGAFTKIGQHMGWWEGDRPHRFTAPGIDRGMRFFVGLNMKGVDVEQQAERNMRTALLDANAARGKMRKAYREGNLAEARVFFDRVQEESTKLSQFKRRLGELRKRSALAVAEKEAGGGRP